MERGSMYQKSHLAREELKYKYNATLTNAELILKWCNASMGPGNDVKSLVRRFFWLIDDTHIAPYEDCCTLTRSSELHYFRSSIAGSWSIHTWKMAFVNVALYLYFNSSRARWLF